MRFALQYPLFRRFGPFRFVFLRLLPLVLDHPCRAGLRSHIPRQSARLLPSVEALFPFSHIAVPLSLVRHRTTIRILLFVIALSSSILGDAVDSFYVEKPLAQLVVPYFRVCSRCLRSPCWPE